MADEMHWTEERGILLQTNEEHKKINGDLRIANKLLRETVEELYNVMSNIDFSAQELVKYRDMPWEKWEAVVYKQPVQLRLF